ncbi:MAG: DUF4188 domain-containing protein [Acidimicrobiia bacterium]
MTHNGRFTAELDGDFVVFLIGARLNRLRDLGPMIRIGRQMGEMQRVLAERPELGCLHAENWNGRTSISVQYWRSFEHLERFARDPELPHLEPWRAFNRLVRDNGAIGIWHETYLVSAGSFEAIYGNMPRMGLAAAGDHVRAGRHSTAARRTGRSTTDQAPVEAY